MRQKQHIWFILCLLPLLFVGVIIVGSRGVWADADTIESHPWDVNRDGLVDRADLVYVAENFASESRTPADVNSDGIVDIVDLVIVAIHFGEDYRYTMGSVIFDDLIDYNRSMQYPKGCLEGKADIDERGQPVYELWDYRPVPTVVHYPIVNGNPKKNCPLVFISHGGGGNWESNITLRDKLVQEGFVVIIPEHYGSNTKLFECLTAGGMKPWYALASMGLDPYFKVNRPKDISFLIDKAGEWNNDTGSPLYGTMDLSRIVVTGHSAGAYTSQAIAGSRVNIYNKEAGNLTESDLFSFADPRVKAVAPISPVGAPLFMVTETINPFAKVDIPVMIIIGEYDSTPTTPFDQRFVAWRNMPDTGPKKYEIILEDSSHFDFSDIQGGSGGELYLRAPEDSKRISSELIYLFFDYYLNGNPESGSKLNKEYAKSLCSPLPDLNTVPNKEVNDILSWKESGGS